MEFRQLERKNYVLVNFKYLNTTIRRRKNVPANDYGLYGTRDIIHSFEIDVYKNLKYYLFDKH